MNRLSKTISSLPFAFQKFFISKKKSFNNQILLEMLKIYEESLFQDKRIRALFPSSERAYNKEKKRKYENHLKKLGLIAYNEEFLNCNTNKNFSKIYRINNCSYKKKSSTTTSFGENNYILEIPKNHISKFSWYKPNSELNEHRTINLKYLNQKASFRIYDDTFFYYIETFLRLPNYSKNIKYWIKKQIDCYILKLLREGKLVKKAYSDKILKNIKKNKNRSYKNYFRKGYYGHLTLLNKSARDNHFFGLSSLRFKKSEFPLPMILFHNVRLMVNGKMVILSRDINRMLGNGFNDIGELFESFFDIGLNAIGINKREVTSLELVSLEVARELSQFVKTEHRDIPVLKYGKNTQKRNLGYIGFENYYDYIDFSSIDDNGEPIPEYEIEYINRKNRSIDDFIRDIDILLPFDIKEPIIEIDYEIDCFDIAPSKPEITRFRNDFPLEYEILKEINEFNYSIIYENIESNLNYS